MAPFEHYLQQVPAGRMYPPPHIQNPAEDFTHAEPREQAHVTDTACPERTPQHHERGPHDRQGASTGTHHHTHWEPTMHQSMGQHCWPQEYPQPTERRDRRGSGESTWGRCQDTWQQEPQRRWRESEGSSSNQQWQPERSHEIAAPRRYAHEHNPDTSEYCPSHADSSNSPPGRRVQNAKPYANGKGKAQKGKGRGSTPSPGKGRGKGGKTKAYQRYGESHQYHTPTTTRHASDTAVSVGTNSDSAPTEISALVRQPAQTTTVADRPTPNMVSNFGSLRDALRAVPDSKWLDHSACESDIRLHDGFEMLKNTPSSTMLQEPHNLVDKMLEGTPMEPLQDEYEPTEEPSPETSEDAGRNLQG